jgi:beta-lactam-binding protein with PASTA domain
MRPPTTPIAVTGGSYPAEIWQHFMSAALAGRPPTPFPEATTTTTAPRNVVVGPSEPSFGPLLLVPDVRTLPVAEATALLQAAGFRVTTGPAAAGSGPPDTVVVQSPLGAQAPRGAFVTLEVAP